MRKWMGRFDAERHLKCRLASFFWRDANDFMWRIDLVQNTDMQHRSFRAKVFVDMLMAAECCDKRRGMLGTDIPAWSQRVKAFLHSSGIKP